MTRKLPTFRFKVGAFEPRRTVTVRAPDAMTARDRAVKHLDKQYERRNAEPPVGYDLELVD